MREFLRRRAREPEIARTSMRPRKRPRAEQRMPVRVSNRHLLSRLGAEPSWCSPDYLHVPCAIRPLARAHSHPVKTVLWPQVASMTALIRCGGVTERAVSTTMARQHAHAARGTLPKMSWATLHACRPSYYGAFFCWVR